MTRPRPQNDLEWRREIARDLGVVKRRGRGRPTGGSAAERDERYPPPTNPADRVALASRSIRWFNTDKGWEEQYFSQWNDAGASPVTSAQTGGWKPLGRPLVHPTAVVATGGAAADHGSHVEVSTGTTGVLLQGVFTDDFEDYEVIVRASDTSGADDVLIRMAIGSAIQAPAGGVGRNVIQSTGAITGTYAADSFGRIGQGSTAETVYQGAILSPKKPIRTQWRFDSHNPANGNQLRVTGHYGNLDVHDGVWFGLTVFASARIQIFGIGR